MDWPSRSTAPGAVLGASADLMGAADARYIIAGRHFLRRVKMEAVQDRCNWYTGCGSWGGLVQGHETDFNDSCGPLQLRVFCDSMTYPSQVNPRKGELY